MEIIWNKTIKMENMSKNWQKISGFSQEWNKTVL